MGFEVEIDGASRPVTIGHSGFTRLRTGDEDVGYAVSTLAQLLPVPPEDTEYALWSRDKLRLVVASSRGEPAFIDRIHRDSVERACTFGRRADAVLLITGDADPTLCLLHNTANPPAPPEYSGLSYHELGQPALARDAAIATRTAELDIDNDGHVELVALATRNPDDRNDATRWFPLVFSAPGSRPVPQPLIETLNALIDREGADSIFPFDVEGQVHLLVESKTPLASRAFEVERTVLRLDGPVETRLCQITTGPGLRALNEWDLLSAKGGPSGAIDIGWNALFKKEDLAILRDLQARSLVPLANERGDSILNGALRAKRPDVLRFLLERGVNPDPRPKPGASFHMSPLQEAVWRGTDEDVSILLEFGADPDGGPLGEAISRGTAAKLELLLKAGAKRVNTINCDVACTARHLSSDDPKVALLREYFPGLEFKKETCATTMKLGICLPE